MTELNPIEIDSFPEVSDLLSSDKIIIFEQTNNSLSPRLYNVADLSAIAIFANDVDDIEDKVNLIKGSILNAINYLQKTFITKTDAASIYAKITNLNTELAKLEKTTSFMNRMSNKAEMAYLDYLYNKMRAYCALIKARLGDGEWGHDGAGVGYKAVTASIAKQKTM